MSQETARLHDLISALTARVEALERKDAWREESHRKARAALKAGCWRAKRTLRACADGIEELSEK